MRRARLHRGGAGRRSHGRRLRTHARRAARRGRLRPREGCTRRPGRCGGRLLRPPEPRAEARRCDGHQRQDDHRHAALRPGACARLPRRPHLDGGLPHRRRAHRVDPHHARPRAPQRHAAPHGRRRVQLLLHGVLVARHRPGADPRARLRRRALHQHHPRPPRLPQNLRRVHPRQEALLRPAAAGGLRADQRRRPQRRGDAPEHRRAALHLLAALDGRLPGQNPRDAPRRHAAAHRRQRGVGRLPRALQRQQPAGRLRHGLPAGIRPRGGAARHECAAPRERTAGVHPRRQRHHRRGGLRPYARRAGERPPDARRGTPPRTAAHRRLRLRRRPRPHQAPRDGADCRQVRLDGHLHLGQPAPRVARGDSRRDDGRTAARRPLPAHHRPRRGHPHGRDALGSGRPAARGRQGARDLPDCGRRAAPLR